MTETPDDITEWIPFMRRMPRHGQLVLLRQATDAPRIPPFNAALIEGVYDSAANLLYVLGRPYPLHSSAFLAWKPHPDRSY